ncbi:MAG: hypothetical protein SGJ02_01185 [bacterium]|nr:hypothetical protein [bacterium]
MNSIHRVLISSFTALFVYNESLLAQPTVTNEVETLAKAHSILITFLQDDLTSMMGCHYNLFAATKKSQLASLPGKGVSVATFERNESLVQIIANPLRYLKRSEHGSLRKKSVKIYLRTLLSCPAAQNGLSEIVAVSVPTKLNGKITKPRDFLYEMKYHMQYYNP